jgi:hypothetical protein
MLLAASGSWTLFQLGLLLAGLLGAALWLRHRTETRGIGPGGRSIRLTAEHALHVVDVRGRTYVIGTGPAGPPSLISLDEGPRRPSPHAGEAVAGPPTLAVGSVLLRSELPPTPPDEPQPDGR